jgi:hypothetical protein
MSVGELIPKIVNVEVVKRVRVYVSSYATG